MKITSVEIIPVLVPMDTPYGELQSVPAVVVRAQTDQGVEGIGHAITLGARHFRSIAVAAEEMAELLVGEDPRRPERIHRKLLPDGQGAGGIGNVAAAALDVAVWDLTGKLAERPLYQLLGGYRDRIPVYASLRLGREVPSEQLPERAASLVEQGFRAMKMNLGGQPNLEAELARARSVREAIGPDIRLLADVNFRWRPSAAIRAGRRLEEVQLFWLEDPVPTHQLDGLAAVVAALDTTIASGEALYSLPAFRHLFEARASDVPMPDLVRVGGITPFLKIAHLAEAFGLPLACHLLPEISAQVVAAAPNGLIVEYVPWAWKLFDGCPRLERGELVMSDRPGHGMELDADFVAHYRAQ
jgi:L-alanine-DL-glutamate epimerase-like enolase superfamily enzyme